MVIKYILFITLVVLCTILYIVYRYNKRNTSSISFRESIFLTDLPVVSFNVGDRRLNFLLDTGSNVSYINKYLLPSIDYTTTSEVSNYVSPEGNITQVKGYNITLSYKTYTFEELVFAADLESAFNVIKQESGVQIHGIIGNRFFERYKYVLNFKNLTAYIK